MPNIEVMGPEELGGAFKIPDGIDPSEIPDRLRTAMMTAFGGGDNADSSDDNRAKMAPEVIIPKLLALCVRYVQTHGTHQAPDCPYRVGGLVHPAEGSGYRGRNQPHVVLESRVAEPNFVAYGDLEPSSSGWGKRLDLRVGYFSMTGGEPRYGSFWVESFEFEAYEP